MLKILTKILEALSVLFKNNHSTLENKEPELVKEEPEVKTNWYPRANLSKHKMKTKGKYAKGFPLGAVVHFTAGRDGAENVLKWGAEQGFVFVCIQKDGKMFQAHPVDEWGSHSGKSAWAGLFGTVSDDLIGIELCAAGKLTEKPDGLYTYFGTKIPRENARYTPGKANQEKGWYEKFTPEQEETLIEFLLWLKRQNPDLFSFDLVLGHDEVSGPAGLGFWRKNDPGAALSMTMPELRELLKQKRAGGA